MLLERLVVGWWSDPLAKKVVTKGEVEDRPRGWLELAPSLTAAIKQKVGPLYGLAVRT